MSARPTAPASSTSRAVTEAREATAKLANDSRDEDLDGPVGFDSQAQRKREFAADMGLQAHALRMAAEGAVAAYEQVVGETWKPFERPVETRRRNRRSQGGRGADGGVSTNRRRRGFGPALFSPLPLTGRSARPALFRVAGCNQTNRPELLRHRAAPPGPWSCAGPDARATASPSSAALSALRVRGRSGPAAWRTP